MGWITTRIIIFASLSINGAAVAENWNEEYAITATPSPYKFAECDASSIPQVTDWKFRLGEPEFWHGGLPMGPCYEASNYNRAIVRQAYTRFEHALWMKDGFCYKIMERGKENLFMKTSIQFALTIMKTANVSNNNVTSGELIGRFGKNFGNVRCLSTGIATLGFFPCEKAVISSSIGQTSMIIFENNPEKYMRLTQSKVLIYTLMFGEYKPILRKIIERSWRLKSFEELLSYADAYERNDVATFLNLDRAFRWRIQDRVDGIMVIAEHFLNVFYTCILQLSGRRETTMEECIDTTVSSLAEEYEENLVKFRATRVAIREKYYHVNGGNLNQLLYV